MKIANCDGILRRAVDSATEYKIPTHILAYRCVYYRFGHFPRIRFAALDQALPHSLQWNDKTTITLDETCYDFFGIF